MSACHSFLKRAAGLALVLCAGILIGWQIPRPQSRPPLAGAPVASGLAEVPVAKEPVPPPEAPRKNTFPPPENPAARVRALLESPLIHQELPELLTRIASLPLTDALDVLRRSQTMANDGSLPKNVGQTLMMAALSRMADLDSAQAIRELASLHTTRGQGAAVIMERIASKDPQKAAALLSSEFQDALGPGSKALAATLGAAWAARDYDQALAWTLRQEGGMRDSALTGIINAAFERDPRKALELYAQITDQSDRRRAEWRLMGQWAEKDPAKALEFVRTLEPDRQAEQHRSLFKRWAENDLAGSLRGFEKVPEGSRQAAAENIVEVWARNDPATAARWLRDQPQTNAGFNAVSELTSAWGLRDPEAASQWVKALPPGEQREGAISGLVTSQQDRDTASAVAWAEQLGNPAVRSRKLGTAYQIWRRTDPAAAQAWLSQTPGLTEPQKATLRSER